MRKLLTVLMIATLLPMLAVAQSQKDKDRWAYVSTQMKLSKDVKAKVQPVFYNYLRELRAAKDIYDTPKNNLLTAIRKNKLTVAQANQLTNARWASDAKELEVRRAYTKKFSAMLTPQQVYYLFSYANDSKSKREAKKN